MPSADLVQCRTSTCRTPTKLPHRFGLIRSATILFFAIIRSIAGTNHASEPIETALMSPDSSTRCHQCTRLTLSSTPHKFSDDVIRLYARDTFGSSKSNVRRKQQGRDTKETDHLTARRGNMLEEWCPLLSAFYIWQENKLFNPWNWTFL